MLQIRYPDGSTEQFTYNGFGQVETHKLRSGGTENFRYDTRGLKTLSWPAPTQSDPNPEQHPTVWTHYTAANGPSAWIDRLKSVKDPLNHSTSYEYNQRGQVTKVTHHDGFYTQSQYNLDGTLAWTADENHPGAATDPNQRTRYEYDDYKRVRKVINPMGQMTENWYGLNPTTWEDELMHTTNTPKWTKSPMRKAFVFGYDENLRKAYQIEAYATADVAWTWFWYDEVGNLIKTEDPRTYQTNFGYDARNRKIWMDSPIASDRNSNGHTMEWKYDGVGSKLKETRADNAFRSWEYDVPNRIIRSIDWRMSTAEPAVITKYERNTTSTIETTTDAKLAVYTFEFDARHRKTKAIYPPASGNPNPTENFWYDAAGNLSLYKNPAGQYKHLDYADSYDSRNRLRHSAWNGSSSSNTAAWSVGPEVRTDFDPASRMTSITTNGGETVVAFGYDDANRKIWEKQTLAGYPTRHIDTPPDDDGNRRYISLSGYVLYYDYNQRNQLAHIIDGNNNPFATFTYDAAGNRTHLRMDWLYAHGTHYTLDELNRVTALDQGDAMQYFQHSHYKYDKAGREFATWRDEDANKGERFTYTTTNHLARVDYKADNVWTGTATNWQTYRVYNYTADQLNWTSVNDNGYLSVRASNGMNQYTNVNSFVPGYDANFNQTSNYYGATFLYNAANQLVGGSMQATYDGLGRCVRRTVGGVTTLFTYDEFNPIVEWDSGGNWRASNIYGAKPDEVLGRHDAVYGALIYKQDRRGDVTFLLDGANRIIEKYTYDAFGRPAVTSWNYQTASWKAPSDRSSFGNRFMFTGQQWLAEINAYDYRRRLYDPDLGRFLQTDPIGLQTEGDKLSAGQKALFSPGFQAPEAFSTSEMNLYRYCSDDPVDGSDPLGLEFNGAGEARLVHDLKDADGLVLGGLTGPYDVTIATGVLQEAKGTFSIIVTRFDVTVVDKQVARTINGRTRSPGEITESKAHEDLHENKARREHDANQNKVLKTGLTRAQALAQERNEKRALVDRFTRNREQEQRDCKKGVGEWKPIRREEYKK